MRYNEKFFYLDAALHAQPAERSWSGLPMTSTIGHSRQVSSLLGLLQFVRPYRGALIGAAIALVLTAGFTLSIGQGVRVLIDRGFGQQSTAQLTFAILLLLGLTLLMAAGNFVRFYLISWLGERVSADIRIAVFNHVVELHPSYFESNRSGEIMSRLTTDTTLLQVIVGSSLSMALRSSLTFAGSLVMLLVTNLKLSSIVLICIPMVLAPILLFGRRVRKLGRKGQDSIADVGSYAGEAIHHIKTVQSYTREETEKRAFRNEVERAFDIARRLIKQRALLLAAVILLVFGSIAGMLWVGGNDVLTGRMTGGELGAFVFYAVVMAMGAAAFSEVYSELQRAAGAAERLVELLRVESLIQPPEVQSIEKWSLAPELHFADVSFFYPSRPNHPAIRHLSLHIEEGNSLALVGPSGAGKSTVFELLERFYDPQQGQIRLGGVDIRELDPKLLRRQIALVPQQPALFTADVDYNIRYGNPEANDEEVIAAAKAAHAHDFIMKLPEGYSSKLGEQGIRLSGGQRQRIAIARAILKNPNILLLDEATSALDSESEFHVQQALGKLMENRTTIIIAHRLSTILHVDKIAVVDHGQLVSLGTHASLMATSDLYQRLAALQFRESGYS